MPKSRTEYWSEKFTTNVARDVQVAAELEESGWTVATIWECETKDEQGLLSQLKRIFNNKGTIRKKENSK